MRKSIKERLMSKIKINEETGCWEWIGGTRDKRYGSICITGHHCQAHRVSYTVFKGDIPKGLLVCHKCDNTRCINPEHLFLGTNTDNMQDCISKGRKINSFGNRNKNAKLTKEDVLEIRSSTKLLKELSEIYNVSKATISKVKARIRYANID